MPDTSRLVLIVEDEPDNREIIRTVVEDYAGFAAMLADGGAQALELIRQRKPDLILLDLMMPEMNGFEVMKHLKADPFTADIPVLAVTALTRPQDRKLAFESGCVDYVDKPFDLDTLEAQVKQYLGA